MAPYSPDDVGVDPLTPAPPYIEHAEEESHTTESDPVSCLVKTQILSNTASNSTSGAKGQPSATSSTARSSSLRAIGSWDATVELPLVVKTDALLLGSGFKYNQSLFQLGVSPEEWEKLSNEIVNIAKPKAQHKAGYVTAGILLETSGALGLGYLAARNLARRHVIRNVRQSFAADDGLSSVLNRWNEECFAPLGLVVRLYMPEDLKKKPSEIQSSSSDDKNGVTSKLAFKDRVPGTKAWRTRRRFALVLHRLGDGNVPRQKTLEELTCDSDAPSNTPDEEEVGELDTGDVVPRVDARKPMALEQPIDTKTRSTVAELESTPSQFIAELEG